MAPGRDIVVIAASAGGLNPLRTLLHALPPDLPAALFVVVHVPATGGRSLPHILDRAGPLPARTASEGERIRVGRVYVAPSDRHLVIAEDIVRLSHGPWCNGVRPAADPLFRSAALSAGPRTIAVVLSGALDDAALGSGTVERHGGRVLVQDPDEADYDSMPRSTLRATEHAIVAPVADLAREIVRLNAEGTGTAETDSAVERAMWLAIRSLEERGRLSARLADGARARGHGLSARQFSRAAEEARRSADLIREVVIGMSSGTIPEAHRA